MVYIIIFFFSIYIYKIHICFTIRVCHFCKSQSIQKHIQQVGLSINDFECALKIRCFSALAYVPANYR